MFFQSLFCLVFYYCYILLLQLEVQVWRHSITAFPISKISPSIPLWSYSGHSCSFYEPAILLHYISIGLKIVVQQDVQREYLIYFFFLFFFFLFFFFFFSFFFVFIFFFVFFFVFFFFFSRCLSVLNISQMLFGIKRFKSEIINLLLASKCFPLEKIIVSLCKWEHNVIYYSAQFQYGRSSVKGQTPPVML